MSEISLRNFCKFSVLQRGDEFWEVSGDRVSVIFGFKMTRDLSGYTMSGDGETTMTDEEKGNEGEGVGVREGTTRNLYGSYEDGVPETCTVRETGLVRRESWEYRGREGRKSEMSLQ